MSRAALGTGGWGSHHLGGRGRASSEHQFCFKGFCLERCWEIKKCSERKGRIIGSLENLPSSERN